MRLFSKEMLLYNQKKLDDWIVTEVKDTTNQLMDVAYTGNSFIFAGRENGLSENKADFIESKNGGKVNVYKNENNPLVLDCVSGYYSSHGHILQNIYYAIKGNSDDVSPATLYINTNNSNRWSTSKVYSSDVVLEDVWVNRPSSTRSVITVGRKGNKGFIDENGTETTVTIPDSSTATYGTPTFTGVDVLEDDTFITAINGNSSGYLCSHGYFSNAFGFYPRGLKVIKSNHILQQNEYHFVVIGFYGYLGYVTSNFASVSSLTVNTQRLGTDHWTGIAYGNDTFMIVDINGYVATSTDNGETWSEKVNTGIGGSVYGIAYGDGRFIICSTNGKIAMKRVI